MASSPFNEHKSDCWISCISYGAHFPCNIDTVVSAKSTVAARPYQSGGSAGTAQKRASGLLRDLALLERAPELGSNLTGLFQYKPESHLSPTLHR